MLSPGHHRLEHPAHIFDRDRSEIARVPTARVVETEQPDLAGGNPTRAPHFVIERPPGAIARRRSAVRKGHSVDRNPFWGQLYYVARQRADYLRDRLGSRRAIALAEITVGESCPRDRGWKTGRNQGAAASRSRDKTVNSCRSGAVG